MLPPDDEPAPRSVQLYGTAPGTMFEAVRRLVDGHGVQHVDLNFGCPVPKVTRKGGGAALPVRRRLFGDIVGGRGAGGGARRGAVHGEVPHRHRRQLVTHLAAGRIAEAEGAAAVALHARTAEQRYAASARWDAIAELKAAVRSIPVLGNGDMWEAGDAAAMMAATGCDGVVVGRGCLGRPWLFAELVDVFAGRAPGTPRPLGEVLAVLGRHADLLVADAGERSAMRSMRRHSQWYLQGYPVGGEVRRQLAMVEDRRQLDGVARPASTQPWSRTRGPRPCPAGTPTGPVPSASPTAGSTSSTIPRPRSAPNCS